MPPPVSHNATTTSSPPTALAITSPAVRRRRRRPATSGNIDRAAAGGGRLRSGRVPSSVSAMAHPLSDQLRGCIPRPADTGRRSSERSQSGACHDQLVTDPRAVDGTTAAVPEAPALPHLLLVEDDRALAPLLVEVLADNHAVDYAPDGQAGLHLALTRSYDVMVIDRGLPAIDGLDLVGRLRARGISTPILLLTARGTLADRVEGLDPVRQG